MYSENKQSSTTTPNTALGVGVPMVQECVATTAVNADHLRHSDRLVSQSTIFRTDVAISVHIAASSERLGEVRFRGPPFLQAEELKVK